MNDHDARTRSERQALELLPWYVNGTLVGEEREHVRRALRSSLTCRLEHERLRRMQTLMQGEDAEHAAAERGFERLMARIRASDPAHPAASAPAWRGARLAQAAAVIAVVSGAAWWGFDKGALEPGTFKTLTAESQAGSQALRLRVVFAKGVSEEARASLLARFGLRMAAPPTADGIYTLALPAGADARALADRLRVDPAFAFVATPPASD